MPHAQGSVAQTNTKLGSFGGRRYRQATLASKPLAALPSKGIFSEVFRQEIGGNKLLDLQDAEQFAKDAYWYFHKGTRRQLPFTANVVVNDVVSEGWVPTSVELVYGELSVILQSPPIPNHRSGLTVRSYIRVRCSNAFGYVVPVQMILNQSDDWRRVGNERFERLF